jgi:hypothetical protein
MKQKIEIGVKQRRVYRTPNWYDVVGDKERIDLEYHSLVELTSELNQLSNQYTEKFENLRFDSCAGYDDEVVYHLVGTRLETDEEYASRLRCVESEKKVKESKERQEFERLKKKFESGQQ